MEFEIENYSFGHFFFQSDIVLRNVCETNSQLIRLFLVIFRQCDGQKSHFSRNAPSFFRRSYHIYRNYGKIRWFRKVFQWCDDVEILQTFWNVFADKSEPNVDFYVVRNGHIENVGRESAYPISYVNPLVVLELDPKSDCARWLMKDVDGVVDMFISVFLEFPEEDVVDACTKLMELAPEILVREEILNALWMLYPDFLDGQMKVIEMLREKIKMIYENEMLNGM